MISVNNLTKSFAAVTAVNNISFDVQPNEVVGFLGPNGAGKSTTLKILTCYQSATSGSITVDGKDIFKNPGAVKRVIGYLPENVPLYLELRTEEYLRYRAELKRVPRSRRKKAVDNALDRCLLGDVRHRIIGQLSKGFRQRVGLADALVAEPKILILDEPTIGLDPNQIRQIRLLISELGKDHTVILSSHILPEVEAVCSRVFIINKGKIVGQGSPAQLRANLSREGATINLEVLDPRDKAREALQSIDGVHTVEQAERLGDDLVRLTVSANPSMAVKEKIFDVAVDSGFKLLGISTGSVSLEDVFVKITTQEEAPAEPEDASVESETKEETR